MKVEHVLLFYVISILLVHTMFITYSLYVIKKLEVTFSRPPSGRSLVGSCGFGGFCCQL